MNLLWIFISTRWKMFTEYLTVVWSDYRQPAFRKSDLKLLSSYLFDNPFRISKQYAIDHGEKDLYTYGETPIPALKKIVRECEITSKDVVYELGCGRGRACLWLRHMIGCRVTGIDCIGEFIRRSTPLQDDKLTFIEGDFLEIPFQDATVVYLNGTMLEDKVIERLSKKLASLRPGTKIITVSYPLSEYAPPHTFKVMKVFPVSFHWGIGDVYLQVPLST